MVSIELVFSSKRRKSQVQLDSPGANLAGGRVGKVILVVSDALRDDTAARQMGYMEHLVEAGLVRTTA